MALPAVWYRVGLGAADEVWCNIKMEPLPQVSAGRMGVREDERLDSIPGIPQ